MSVEYFLNLLETDEDKFRKEFITSNLTNTENEYLFDTYLYSIHKQDNIINDINFITDIYSFIDIIYQTNKLLESYIVITLNNIILEDIEYLKNIKMIYFIFKYINKLDKDKKSHIFKKLIIDIATSKYRFDENYSDQFDFEYINLLKLLFNKAVEEAQYTYDDLNNILINIYTFDIINANNLYITSDLNYKFEIKKLEKIYFDEENLTLREKILDIILYDINKITYTTDWNELRTMLHEIYLEDEITEKHKIKILNVLNYNEIISLSKYHDDQDPNYIINFDWMINNLYTNTNLIDNNVYEKILSYTNNILLNSILNNDNSEVYYYIKQRLLYVSKDISQIYTIIDGLLYNNSIIPSVVYENIDKYYSFLVEYVNNYLKPNNLYGHDIIGLIYDTYIISEYDHLGIEFLKENYEILDIRDNIYNPIIAEQIFIILLDKMPEKIIDLLDTTPIYATILAKITMSDVDYHPIIDKYLNLLKEQIKKDENLIEIQIKNTEIQLYYQKNLNIPINYSYYYTYIKKYNIEEQMYYYLARLLLTEQLTENTMDLVLQYLIQAGDYLDAKMYRTRLIQEHYMKDSIASYPPFMINNDVETIMNLVNYIKK